MFRSYRLLLGLILLSASLLLMAAFLAGLPGLVRALPGRYAYYLPEPLQAWRYVPPPSTLPTSFINQQSPALSHVTLSGLPMSTYVAGCK
ncbi:MAG TPA: hypothetical protein EYP77_03090 [Anaerolineae bacterium]|nr:hypothetical protein [Anaerolineae bacterium]